MVLLFLYMTKHDLYRIVLREHRMQEKGFSKRYPDFYKEICSIDWPKGFTFRQKLYHWFNNDFDLKLGICCCGNRCSFISLNDGYFKHCCKHCSTLDEEVKQTRSNTCLEKYGCEHESKSVLVKDKKRKTCQKNYGVDWPMQSKINLEKAKQTNLEKFNVEWYFQSNEFADRYKQTCLGKYGVEHPSKSEEVKAKKCKTCMKNFGVAYPSQSKTVRQKYKDTCIERHGVDNPMKNNKIKEKNTQTNIERYRVVRASMLSEIIEKTKSTNLEKHGKEWPAQTTQVKEKIKKTNLEKRGVDVPIKDKNVKSKMIRTNYERYGVPYTCMLPKIKKYSNKSKPNLEFAHMLDLNGIVYEREYVLEKYVYDFKVGKYLIEINPTITHNTYLCIFKRNPLSKDYHIKKTFVAETNGYICIHIWDWTDKNKVIELLKNEKIYLKRNARACLHWYNIKTKSHKIGELDFEHMISQGYLPVYDDGNELVI